MNTLQVITEIKSYINTLPEDDKRYIDYCITNKVFNISGVGLSMLAGLLDRLQTDYRHEEAKRQGGNVALKRQKIAEKILKTNQKDNIRPAFFKCFTEEIDGSTMQIFGNAYFFIALKEEYKTEADTHTPEEMRKIEFRPSKFFDFSGDTYNKIDFDIADIKQKLAEFKAEQKQRPAKERKKHHPIFALGNTGYNAEYFIDIIEALGTDAVLYQNEKSSGISYLEAESGKALLCPCRL